ncbi:MAG: peroxiredoxin [Betaproteobacteria bacterium]|nr:peroxiredoxin [Betaproteobacteria bacterium]
MTSILAGSAALLSLAAANPALAALAVGDSAPDFSAEAVQGKEAMTLALSDLRKTGPVVIFFVPSAFTDAPECRDFASKIDQFRAAGASVVGMSRDSTETLAKFSADECGAKFPLASANVALVDAFDVNDGAMFNTRTTYVIAASGKIAYADNNAEFDGHAGRALAFVQALKR